MSYDEVARLLDRAIEAANSARLFGERRAKSNTGEPEMGDPAKLQEAQAEQHRIQNEALDELYTYHKEHPNLMPELEEVEQLKLPHSVIIDRLEYFKAKAFIQKGVDAANTN